MEYCIMNQPETILIIGPSGCGKTYLLLNKILTEEYRKYFDFIIILCPTIWINTTYLNWKYLKSDSDVIGLDISSEKLNEILKFIIEVYSGSRTAIIVDDMSNNSDIHNNNNLLTYLSYSGRHHNLTLFILSQKLNSISTGIRDNTTRLMFFSTHNKRSLKVLKEEFFGYLSENEEKSMLTRLSTGSYLDINLNNKEYNIM